MQVEENPAVTFAAHEVLGVSRSSAIYVKASVEDSLERFPMEIVVLRMLQARGSSMRIEVRGLEKSFCVEKARGVSPLASMPPYGCLGSFRVEKRLQVEAAHSNRAALVFEVPSLGSSIV